MNAIPDLGPALIALITLGAAWLGRLYERRWSAEAWLRDQRLRAYVRFIEAAHRLWALSATAYDGRGSMEPDEVAALDSAGQELDRMASELDLLGPEPVRAAGAEVVQTLRIFGGIAVDVAKVAQLKAVRRLSTSTEQGKAALAAEEAFRDAARAAVDPESRQGWRRLLPVRSGRRGFR